MKRENMKKKGDHRPRNPVLPSTAKHLPHAARPILWGKREAEQKRGKMKENGTRRRREVLYARITTDKFLDFRLNILKHVKFRIWIG